MVFEPKGSPNEVATALADLTRNPRTTRAMRKIPTGSRSRSSESLDTAIGIQPYSGNLRKKQIYRNFFAVVWLPLFQLTTQRHKPLLICIMTDLREHHIHVVPNDVQTHVIMPSETSSPSPADHGLVVADFANGNTTSQESNDGTASDLSNARTDPVPQNHPTASIPTPAVPQIRPNSSLPRSLGRGGAPPLTNGFRSSGSGATPSTPIPPSLQAKLAAVCLC